MANAYFSPGCGDIMDPTNEEESSLPTHWQPDEVLKLIDLVQADEAIYNPHHQYYYSKPYVENFWHNLDIKLNKKPGESLSKWTYLRLKFRREYSNYVKDKVRPCWSYFERMCFIQPYLKRKLHHRRPCFRGNAMYCRCTPQDHLGAVGGHDVTNENEQASQQRSFENYSHYMDDDYKKVNESQLPEDQMQDDIATEPKDGTRDYRSEIHQTAENPDEMEPSDNTINNYAIESLPTARNSREVYMERRKLIQDRMEVQMDAPSPAVHVYNHPEQHFPQNPHNQSSQHKFSSQRAPMNATNSLRNQREYPTNGRCNNPTYNQAFRRDFQHRHNCPLNAIHEQDEYLESLQNSNCSISAPHGYRDNFGGLNEDIPAPKSSRSLCTARSSIHTDAHCVSSDEHAEESTTAMQTDSVDTLVFDCKNDPDAMFLLSLLPELRKIDGRRRSKIKIEFQRILLEYIYPE